MELLQYTLCSSKMLRRECPCIRGRCMDNDNSTWSVLQAEQTKDENMIPKTCQSPVACWGNAEHQYHASAPQSPLQIIFEFVS